VPSLIAVVLHPERRKPAPEPVPVNMRPVALTGIGAWVVAMIVAWVLWYLGDAPITVVWTCGAGVVLGVAGLGLVRGRGWS
jgi:hypothetical protein